MGLCMPIRVRRPKLQPLLCIQEAVWYSTSGLVALEVECRDRQECNCCQRKFGADIHGWG